MRPFAAFRLRTCQVAIRGRNGMATQAAVAVKEDSLARKEKCGACGVRLVHPQFMCQCGVVQPIADRLDYFKIFEMFGKRVSFLLGFNGTTGSQLLMLI